MTEQRRPPTARPAETSRQDREAAALRANLARRKAQSRGRAAVGRVTQADGKEAGREEETRD
jgi:hypothetical protein